jgi:hypothetical protein
MSNISAVRVSPAARRDADFPPPHLVHPVIDFLLVGGLSMIFFAAVFLLMGKSESTFDLGWTMFYLTFAINGPHFLLSYQHFYYDHRAKLLSHWKWFAVAFLVPGLIVVWLAAAAAMGSMMMLGWTVNAMFFFVGWHYVKQIFGCFTVFSARAQYRMNDQQRLALKVNLFALWGMSYLNGNQYMNQLDFYSVKYYTIAMPAAAMPWAYALIGATGLWALWTFVQKYIDDGDAPPFNAWVAWATIYVWYIPAFHHPAYFLMIPAFHSLQYILFSGTYTYNRVQFEAARAGANPREARRLFVRDFVAYGVLAVVLGALAFEFVPKFFDKSIAYQREILGATFFLAAFNLFINIHHYFIDHLIWRGNLPEVRKHLLGRN